jgi:hypothetical protein
MRGELLDACTLGWHGLEGDRRLAFRRLDERGGFPWLTGTKLPALILFTPQRRDGANGDALPSHVVTPEGEAMPPFAEALATDVGRRCKVNVQMMELRHGIFDDATISVITSDTVREVCGLAGKAADVRREPCPRSNEGSGACPREHCGDLRRGHAYRATGRRTDHRSPPLTRMPGLYSFGGRLWA